MGLDHHKLEKHRQAVFAANLIGQNTPDHSGYSIPTQDNLLAWYLGAGSGGVVLVTQQRSVINYGLTRVTAPYVTTSRHNRTLPLTEGRATENQSQDNPTRKTLDRIKSTFQLTDEQLSAVLDCSRKSLNNWRAQTKPSGRKQRRLWRFLQAADDWSDANYPNPGHYLEREIIGSKTLLDLLSAKDIDLEEVAFAGSRILLWDSELRNG